MSCDECNETFEYVCPPFINVHQVKELFDKACAPCVRTVPAGTLPAAFCAWFDGSMDACCDVLYVFEGTSLWVSDDCSTWVQLGVTDPSADILAPKLVADLSPVGVNSVTISSLPAANSLRMLISYNSDVVPPLWDDIYVEFNADAVAANYGWVLFSRRETLSSVSLVSNNDNFFAKNRWGTALPPAGFQSINVIDIYNHSNASFYTYYDNKTIFHNVSELQSNHLHGKWRNSSVVTSIKLIITNSGLFQAGSFIKLFALNDIDLHYGS
jgi:hypothetical protein